MTHQLLLVLWYPDMKLDYSKIFILFASSLIRLSHEWQAYISRTHSLRKTFISVKGIYYQVMTIHIVDSELSAIVGSVLYLLIASVHFAG